MKQMAKCFAFVGNWGMRPIPEGYGFSVYRYDFTEGTLSLIGDCALELHVGAACIDNEKKVLYCVSEEKNLSERSTGIPGGRIVALQIDTQTGMLKELNEQPSFAPLPSYCALDETGSYLIATNHSGGDPVSKVTGQAGSYGLKLICSDAPTVAYPLNPDGRIGDACSVYLNSPADNSDSMSMMAHPHCVIRAMNIPLFFVCDKGLDLVYSFRLKDGELQKAGSIKAPDNSAPRYGCVHPSQPYLFINHERLPEVTSYRYADDGSLTEISSVSVLKDKDKDKKDIMQSSDIKIHPDGRYLYNILRGSNLVSVIEVEEATGVLHCVQTVHFSGSDFVGGGARGCGISPDGKYLFVCSPDDGTIHRFTIKEGGLLEESEVTFNGKRPANITFYVENC